MARGTKPLHEFTAQALALPIYTPTCLA
jgi:hypothetical protein